MRVRDEDLTALARIRNAALAGFAERGTRQTSIRDVAATAEVSAGLVQHHFVNKAGLVEAVNSYVLELIGAEIEQVEFDQPAETLFEEIGNRITGFVRDNRLAVLYVARSASAGEEAGFAIFDSLTALVCGLVDRLTDEGLLDQQVDRLWTALHLVILNLGTVLLEDAVSRNLDAPFRDPAQLERWNQATSRLFQRSLKPD